MQPFYNLTAAYSKFNINTRQKKTAKKGVSI